MSYIFNQDSRYSINLLDSWKELSDGDQSVYTFIKVNEAIGAFQISLAKKILEQTPTEAECVDRLNNYFQKLGLHPQIVISSIDFGFVGYADVVTLENKFLAIWLFISGQRYAFVTYNCSNSQKSEEINEVKQMVNSFRLIG